MRSRVVEAYKKERHEVFNKQFGVVFNGKDNQTPVVVENLIASSPTALLCCDMYASFIGGGGFEHNYSSINLSADFWQQKNPNDLLFDICASLSKHRGVFIQIRYNGAFEKETFKVVPYTLCRVGKKDSKNYAGRIVVSPTGWGKLVKKDKAEVFDTYNAREDVIQEQVERDGGWHNYKGQILFFSLQPELTYPKSIIESVDDFADTENQIGKFYNSIVHRGFNDITIIRHRPFDDKTTENDFVEHAENVTGVENAASVWMIEDDWDDNSEKQSNIRFDKISNDQKPDRYSHVESSTANYIRKAYKIPAQLVDFIQGKLGNTNGKDIEVWQGVYNKIIERDRSKVELLFAEMFKNFKTPLSGGWKIKEYTLSNGSIVNK